MNNKYLPVAAVTSTIVTMAVQASTMPASITAVAATADAMAAAASAMGSPITAAAGAGFGGLSSSSFSYALSLGSQETAAANPFVTLYAAGI